ncbi:MAG: M56 family metallopeptidase, partial [Pirellulaceae bacterium]|nr:M56 family metallopeptidase [Pirellulaceae bacterium]
MAWYSLLELPIAWRLGWTLVHFLWQGACLLLLVQMILLLLNRESANSRYLAMVCGLLAMAAMPVLTFSRLASSPPPATTGEVFASTGETSAETQPIATTASPRTRVSEVSSPQRAKQSDQPTSSGRHNATANAWVPWLSAAWAIGVLMGSLRLIAGWWAIGALRKDRQFPCGEGAARAALDRMCAIVGVRAECVELIESARASTPLVVGWLRPAILLPVGMATGMTTSEMEAVFAHELAHIRRADYVVNLLQSLVETWLFFHPAVWLLSAWVRAERELCCDDIAVAAVGDRLAYARTLAKLAESARAAGLGVPATGGRVYERIQRIAGSADTQRRSHAWLPGVLAIACLLCAAATLIDTSPVDASAPPADERASNERAAGAAAAQPAAQASPLVIQLPNGDIKFNFEKTAWSDALAAAAAGIGYEIHIARDAPGVITHTSKRGYSKNEAIRLLKLELLKRGREMRFDKGSNRFEVVDANRAARERKTELLDAPPLKEHFELLDYRFGSKGRFAPARVFRFKAKRDIAAKELARLLGREFDDRSFRRWSDGERVVVDGYVVRQDDKWRGKNPPNVPVGDTLEVWKNAGYGWNERELFPKRTLIAGVVRDADGPVAGAIVSASYSEGRALGGNYGSTVTTAGDGRFDVRITDSSYARMKTVSLTVSAKGRAPRRVGPFEVAAGKDLDPVDVMLDNGFTAEIRFASAVTGAAVTSGVVTVRQSGYSHPPRFEGLFQDVVKAAHVSRNPLRVTVRASGYEEAYFNNVELPPDGRLTLELHPTKQAGFRLVSEITGRA